jgi:hypothetical protein
MRFVAVNEARPNKPRQAMNIARPQKHLIFFAGEYPFCTTHQIFDREKLYSKGYIGATLLYSSFMVEIAD